MGKTTAAPSSWTSRKKHPHARGEDLFLQESSTGLAETPPRTWGRLQRHQRDKRNRGNTPTHVGKTPEHGHVDSMHGKHPHARGEDAAVGQLNGSQQETPPRTWGRRAYPRHGRLPYRNTPTHVGKTKFYQKNQMRARKHPHARGEDKHSHTVSAHRMETPPRTWGRHSFKIILELIYRNTPTHVGKTSCLRAFSSAFWKHPHARGEDTDAMR